MSFQEDRYCYKVIITIQITSKNTLHIIQEKLRERKEIIYGHYDLIWDGLVCPPLEDDPFNFDISFTLDDNIFDDPLLQVEDYFNEDDEGTPPCCDFVHNSGRKFNGKDDIRTRMYGKGKELTTLRTVLKIEEYNKTSFDCQPKQQQVVVVVHDHKRKKDYDLRSEGKVTRRCGNHGNGKELNTTIHVLNLDEA